MNWAPWSEIAVAVALLASSAPNSEYIKPTWPVMKRTSYSFDINLRSNSQFIKAFLKDKSGKPIYKFTCFIGNESSSQHHELTYSGGLMCGLGVVYDKSDVILGNRSLLSDGKTSAMFSRGNFNPEEIVGYCSRYPDFGRVRKFVLRRMIIIIALTKVQISPWYNGGGAFRRNLTNVDRRTFPIGKIQLSVEVNPTDLASSPYAVDSVFADPKGNQEICRKMKQ